MKVVKTEKVRKSLIEITFEDGSCLLLDKEFFLNCAISVGSDLDESQIEKLKVDSDFVRAKSRAIYYLSNGDLSKKSLIKKLRTAGFLEQNVVSATNRMEELGYINDEKYAKRLLESFARQNISLNEAKHKLFEKGIEPEVMRDVLENYDVNPIEQIKEIISKKYSAKLNTPENINKVFSALVRKGFGFADIKKALREYAEDIEFSED